MASTMAGKPEKEALRQSPADVVRFIRDAILSGEYKPGGSLRQDAIAKRLDISKVPVREALKQLETEGLVEFHTNKGAFVRQYSAEEVREIGELAAIIEARLVRLSVPHMTFVDHGNLEQILALMEVEEEREGWFDRELQFRMAMIQRADRPLMTQTLRGFVENRALRANLLLVPTLQKTVREYRTILDAAKANDADGAAVVMQASLLRLVNEAYHHLKAS